MTNEKVFNDFWNALAAKRETLPKTCDSVVRLKLEDLSALDDYDLMTVKEVRKILNECLPG